MRKNGVDSRGYTTLHQAFRKGTWTAVKRAANGGAPLDTLTPSGTSLKDFAQGLGHLDLYNQLVIHVKGKKSR